MSSFVINDVDYYLRFSNPLSFESKDELEKELVAISGNRVRSQPSSGEDSQTMLRMVDGDGTEVHLVGENSILGICWLSGKREKDEDNYQKLKDFASNVAASQSLSGSYESMSVGSRGFYFPSDTEDPDTSKGEVAELLKSILRVRTTEDILKVSIKISHNVSLGVEKEVMYSAARNKQSGLYAIKIEISERFGLDVPLDPDQIKSRLSAGNILKDMQLEQKALEAARG